MQFAEAIARQAIRDCRSHNVTHDFGYGSEKRWLYWRSPAHAACECVLVAVKPSDGGAAQDFMFFFAGDATMLARALPLVRFRKLFWVPHVCCAVASLQKRR